MQSMYIGSNLGGTVDVDHHFDVDDLSNDIPQMESQGIRMKLACFTASFLSFAKISNRLLMPKSGSERVDNWLF